MSKKKSKHSLSVSRRQFLGGVVATAGSIAYSKVGTASQVFNKSTLPRPENSGIQHIIVVTMSGRSFDHMLGWLPAADGKQAGLAFADDNGVMHPTYALAPEFQACGETEPGHDCSDYATQFAGGALNGWLTGAEDTLALGYYQQQDLGFLGGAAPAWTTFDRYFSATPGGTLPNRLHLHAAQTDRLASKPTRSSLPTIWDRLAGAGVSRRYYFNDVPFLALWGDHYRDISHPYTQFLNDAATGNLPQVSYVDPRFGDGTPPLGNGAENRPGNNDHAYADVRDGQAFMNDIYQAVTSSPNWKSTVLIFNYDHSGGFYDHVKPPQVPIAHATQKALKGDPTQGASYVPRLGFRTPTIMISPLARRAHVSSRQYDPTSILRMIEWRFGLPPLSIRDATANNLADELDFSTTKNLQVPVLDTAIGPFGIPRAAFSRPAMQQEFAQLLLLAQGSGFPIPGYLELS